MRGWLAQKSIQNDGLVTHERSNWVPFQSKPNRINKTVLPVVDPNSPTFVGNLEASEDFVAGIL